MRHLKASLTLKPDVRPCFCWPCLVPYSIKQKVSQELEGELRNVDHSTWAAPVVPVSKQGCSLEICGNYKVTINPCVQVDQYPLPKPSDLLASLTGGKQFTELDLTLLYQQMQLDDESVKLVTINTH